MNSRTLAEAKNAAETFLSRVGDLEQRIKREAALPKGQGISWDMTGCRESAAVRRASMDLTRALTELRRP